MTLKEWRRLIEVDFPILTVGGYCATEKTVFTGRPSNLHQWWARRPLGACRAVLMGLLLPDPCDPACPPLFRETARKYLASFITGPIETDEALRESLLRFIGDFSSWDNAIRSDYTEVARALVIAANGQDPVLVVDPFAGGGSIPLEALRVGCETFASDLNPVACLILKVMLEDIPRAGPGLVDQFRTTGLKIKESCQKDLAHCYPSRHDGLFPIAYLWARTVLCEAPNCGAEIPLVRSFWLSKKAGHWKALKPRVVRGSQSPRIDLDIFEPTDKLEVSRGTLSSAKAVCLACRTPLAPARIRAQLTVLKGGADIQFDAQGKRVGGARLLAIVCTKSSTSGRYYRLPTSQDYEEVWRATELLKTLRSELLQGGLDPVPDEFLPKERIKGNSGFRVLLYGMTQWGDLFTARQKLALITLSSAIRSLPDGLAKELLAFAISRLADKNSSLTTFDSGRETIGHVFNRQALPMVWDFAEVNVFSESTGSFEQGIEELAKVVEHISSRNHTAQVQQADAANHPLPDDSADIWFTDPPYYDAIAYADLSDFFFVWLKRIFPTDPWFHDSFDSGNGLTPKASEAIQDPARVVRGRAKDARFFEDTMRRAFGEGRRILKDRGVGCVVFAHKTTEGWEALLSGLIKGGWVITASWPIATERAERMVARESAALATSVHLVCRPRPKESTVGDWTEVLRDLPVRVGGWMDRLQNEGVRGADLIFACIGPALEIFSKYSRVETAEGTEVGLPDFLAKVWEAVGRVALGRILGAPDPQTADRTLGALEEDARLTAIFLWTLQSSESSALDSNATETEQEDQEQYDDEDDVRSPGMKGFRLPYDIVRRFAQPLGIHLDNWEGGILETEKGVVRLLPVAQRVDYLLGERGAIAPRLPHSRSGPQSKLFPEYGESQLPVKGEVALEPEETNREEDVEEKVTTVRKEYTTLDRVQTAMLLQRAGRASALRDFLTSEFGRGPQLLTLANALSALYPRDSEEKRLIDAVLLASRRA